MTNDENLSLIKFNNKLQKDYKLQVSKDFLIGIDK